MHPLDPPISPRSFTFDQVRRLPGSWYERVVQRIARGPSVMPDPLRHATRAGIAVVSGVSVVTVIIGVVTSFSHASSVSLLYLLVVIALAAIYGRGPSIVASILAFLAYDFFFIPPFHTFTVADPNEWISLSALFLTGVVVGQLTSELRRRERVAIESEQRTVLLYALAQDIATSTERDDLLSLLTERAVNVFAPFGVMACALLLPGEDAHLRTRAIAHAREHRVAGLQLDATEHLTQAEIAWRDRTVTALVHQPGLLMTFFVPLSSGSHVVGVLSLSGSPGLASLFVSLKWYQSLEDDAQASMPSPYAELFAAFCDQMALALERAELQNEAIQSAALRESDRLKNALLGSVTHDLRTPIAAIQASASSLEQPDIEWDSADRHELLTTITTSSDRLARLVDNLLALSRLEAGVALSERTWYPINDVVATVLDQLERVGILSGRAITVEIAEDPLEAPMDHAGIERVVMNLVENALKYSPPGSPITISAKRSGSPETLEVRVRDQGVGIPPQEREAIFDRFYRIKQPLPWQKGQLPLGTGLGLAICAGIVREHGGQIWVESNDGPGSTFVFILPLVIPSTQPETPTTTSSPEVHA